MVRGAGRDTEEQGSGLSKCWRVSETGLRDPMCQIFVVGDAERPLGAEVELGEDGRKL